MIAGVVTLTTTPARRSLTLKQPPGTVHAVRLPRDWLWRNWFEALPNHKTLGAWCGARCAVVENEAFDGTSAEACPACAQAWREWWSQPER